MATTTPLPPPSQGEDQNRIREAQYSRLVSYTSVGVLILCPLLIALPPRKFDIYTVALISGTAIGGNQVLRDYTGRSIIERVPTLRRLRSGMDMPSAEISGQSREETEGLRLAERRAMQKLGAGTRTGGLGSANVPGPTTATVARAVQEVKTAEEAQASQGSRSLSLQDVEAEEGTSRRRKADWKVQRDAREKEALDEGRGYGGLIMDQIWDVWSGGRERASDEKGEKGKGDSE